MLSIAAMNTGQADYYLSLAREDYYLAGGEPPGVWLGSGSKLLGLHGQVTPQQLRQLFAGYDMAGNKLVQNAGKPTRKAGWDLTFSVPKTVSVLWSQSDDTVRRLIEEAHKKAVHQALQYLEEELAFSRTGQGGNCRERAGLVVAAYEHSTSRALDPQLHFHCLLMNLGVGQDGTTGALDSRLFYQYKMTTGALYRTTLAAELERTLHVIIERVQSWFEIAGVSKQLVAEFSKRRRVIEDVLKSHGLESAAAAAVATLVTREMKGKIPPREELFREWQEIGRSFDHDPRQFRARRHCDARPKKSVQFRRSLNEALEEITKSHSHFSEHQLLRYVAEASQGRGLTATSLRRKLRTELHRSRELVRLNHQGHETRYTTKEILALEKQLLKAVDRSEKRNRHKVSHKTVAKVLGEKPTIKDQQANAVIRLTQHIGRISVATGMAGTGKTFMLDACREIWEREGYKVVGCALSGKAAKQLQQDAKVASRTIESGLFLLDRYYHSETSEDKYQWLDKKSVLIVDEAGMVGTRQMEQLVYFTERAGAKLVLVGDPKQLQPIEAGGPFPAIAEKLGHAQLTDITRQREEWAQEAVHDLANGRAEKALQAFAERGLMKVASDRSEAIDQLVEDWRPLGLRNPEETLIFVGENKEAAIVNRRCQQARLACFRKDPEQEQSVYASGEQFFEGDRILFTRNSRQLGVNNGDIGTILQMDAERYILSVRLKSKEIVHIPLQDYDHVRLGYAITTHKGQGATVDNAFVLLGGSMQDREISYVQGSRAREHTFLYADEFECGEELCQLARQMSKSRAKDLAHDHLQIEQETVEDQHFISRDHCA